MKTLLIFLTILFLSVSSISAQSENSTIIQRAEMKKLERLTGQWRGSGWSQQGGKREIFSGTETVQKKLDGLALLVEGNFKDTQGITVHETLAVLSFDKKANDFRFKTFLASGVSGDHQFKVVENGWQWGFNFPNGMIKYDIKIENDKWIEVGEFSKDGKTWVKFFEMILDKVK